MRLLLVEDKDEFVAVALEALEGHDVQVAKNYQEACGSLKDLQAEGVIIDLFVPKDESEEECHPYGLLVLQECLRRNIPSIIISQGDRHRDFADLRNSMQDEYSKVFSDPLPAFMVNHGSYVKKNTAEPWQTALKSIQSILEDKPMITVDHKMHWMEWSGWKHRHRYAEQDFQPLMSRFTEPKKKY